MCLERLLAIAREHNTCESEQARIEGDVLVIPFDCHHPDQAPAWSIQYERVTSRQELLDALGY